MAEQGIGNVIFAALSQSFFTLSIGIGAMMIFGSYMPKDRALLGEEAVSITALDTSVALTAGFIIIPACFAFGIEPGIRSQPDLYHHPQYFRPDSGRRVLGRAFLPVPDLCRVYHGSGGI